MQNLFVCIVDGARYSLDKGFQATFCIVPAVSYNVKDQMQPEISSIRDAFEDFYQGVLYLWLEWVFACAAYTRNLMIDHQIDLFADFFRLILALKTDRGHVINPAVKCAFNILVRPACHKEFELCRRLGGDRMGKAEVVNKRFPF